jgi:tetratricopeptide (TPR) repeat protein
MDIHIQLAGVSLGPYNEKQVRDYISEGLLSMEDKARIEGSLEWIPVSDLVAMLPPVAAPAAPSADPDSIFLDPEPLTAQAPTAPSPEANQDYVSLVEPPPASHQANNPEPAENPYTAKTRPLGPPTTGAPDALSATGQVKTKPLGPLAPGTPTAASMLVKTKSLGPIAPTPPAGRPKGVTASKSVSTTAPLGQATKKMSRTALAKALQNKTEPLPGRTAAVPQPTGPASSPSLPPPTEVPTGAATKPETTGPMASGVADVATPAPTMPVSKKAAGLPSLLKALAAKTVPLRGGSVTPEAAASGVTDAPPPGTTGRATMPVTTPLPTKAIMNPARRDNRTATPPQTAPQSAPQQPQSPPALEPEKATEKLPIPASKKAAELRAKAAQRAAEREAAEAEPEPEAKPETESKPSDEAAAPRARKRRLPVMLILGLCGGVAVAGAYYVWSPYHASSALRDAMATGSADDLRKLVDFDSLRASLKQEAQLLTPGATASANADALGMVNKSVDVYITPDGVADLFSKDLDQKGTRKSTNDLLARGVAVNLVTTFVNQPLRSQGMASPTDFVLRTDVADMHLNFHGGHWLLSRIDVRPDLAVPAEAAGAPLGLVPVVQSYLARGHDDANANQWAPAIANFTQALTLAPQSTAAGDARAASNLAKGDFDAAIKDYTQALAVDPADTAALNGRGNARAGKGDYDGAINDFSDAVKIDPTLASAYDNRGRAKSAKNDLDGAIQDFTKAIGIDPTLASAFTDRGIARQAHGNFDGAVKDYTDAIALKPHSARTYLNRGLARISQNNLPEAIHDFDKTIELDPSITDAWFQRGNVKSAQHDSNGAIADFTQTLALDPKNALAYCSRGVAHEDKGELADALKDYSKALELDPHIAIAYFRRALIEVRQGNPDGAIADTSQSLDLDPKNTQAYYYRGFAKLLRGNFDGAASDLRLFCDAAPHDRFADNAHLYLWLVAKQQAAHTDPDQDLSDALENGWNNTADDFTAKTAAFLLGRVTETDYLTAANSADASVNATQNCQAYYFAGMKRLIMGDRGTANDYFQKCLATGKRDFCEYILAQAELQQPAPPSPVPAPVAPVAPAPSLPPALPAVPAQ